MNVLVGLHGKVAVVSDAAGVVLSLMAHCRSKNSEKRVHVCTMLRLVVVFRFPPLAVVFRPSHEPSSVDRKCRSRHRQKSWTLLVTSPGPKRPKAH